MILVNSVNYLQYYWQSNQTIDSEYPRDISKLSDVLLDGSLVSLLHREDDARSRVCTSAAAYVHACEQYTSCSLYLSLFSRVCVNNNDWPTRVRGGASSRSRVVHRGGGGHASVYVARAHVECVCFNSLVFSYFFFSPVLSPSFLSFSFLSLSESLSLDRTRPCARVFVCVLATSHITKPSALNSAPRLRESFFPTIFAWL